MSKILIKNGILLPMEKSPGATGDLYFQGDLALEDGLIKAVGEVSSGWQADSIIDATDKVVMPGFVNCHTHAAMTLLRSFADDLPLMQWLEEKIWPLEANLTGDDVYWGTLLAIREMIAGGTTTFADMYFFMDDAAKAVRDSGIRASLSRGMIGMAPNGEQALAESKELVSKWHGEARGRITTMLGPHAPYTCPPEYLKRVMNLAEELEVGIHIHIAETKQEIKDIAKMYGKSPVKHLADEGVFAYPVLGAHCVHVDVEDIKILREKKVKVAHNPESNMKLASGIAPVPEMLDAGITVALGTDGASSNNNLDLLEEMRSAALLHKVNQEDPTVISSYRALEMTTKFGGRALGLPVGTLTAGMKADVILIDFKKPHLYPRHDVPAHLVYAAQAGDVDTVIIDGEVIMENRVVKTIDDERLFAEVSERARRLTQSK